MPSLLSKYKKRRESHQKGEDGASVDLDQRSPSGSSVKSAESPLNAAASSLTGGSHIPSSAAGGTASVGGAGTAAGSAAQHAMQTAQQHGQQFVGQAQQQIPQGVQNAIPQGVQQNASKMLNSPFLGSGSQQQQQQPHQPGSQGSQAAGAGGPDYSSQHQPPQGQAPHPQVSSQGQQGHMQRQSPLHQGQPQQYGHPGQQGFPGHPGVPGGRSSSGQMMPQHAGQSFQGGNFAPQQQQQSPGGPSNPTSPHLGYNGAVGSAGAAGVAGGFAGQQAARGMQSPTSGQPLHNGSPGSGSLPVSPQQTAFQQRYRQPPHEAYTSPLSQPSETPWAEYPIQRAAPSPRFGHSANYLAARDGELFIMGGIRDMDILNDLWVVDTNMLTGYQLVTEGARVGPRVGHAALVLGNAHVVFGGDTKIEETDPLDDNLYLLNTSSLKWTVAQPAGPRPSGRYGHSLSNIGAVVYVFGGQVDEEFYDDMWSFDLTTWRSPSAHWERVQPTTAPPPPRTNHTVVSYNDQLYLFGGANGDLWYSDTWRFDPSTRGWEQLECSGYVPAPCQGHAATIIGDVMYVFGGMSSQGQLIDQLFALKLTTLKWYTFQNLGKGPSPRSGHSLTAFGGDKILVWGGTDQGNSAYVLDVSRINYPDETVGDSTASPTVTREAPGVTPPTPPGNELEREKLAAAGLAVASTGAGAAGAEALTQNHSSNPQGDEKLSPGPGTPMVKQNNVRELPPHVYTPQSTDTSGPTQARSNTAARNSMLFAKRRSVIMPNSPLRDSNSPTQDSGAGPHDAALGAGAAGVAALGVAGLESNRSAPSTRDGPQYNTEPTRTPNRASTQPTSYVTDAEGESADERFVSAVELNDASGQSRSRGHSRGASASNLGGNQPHSVDSVPEEGSRKNTLTKADGAQAEGLQDEQFRKMEGELQGMPGEFPSRSASAATTTTVDADVSQPDQGSMRDENQDLGRTPGLRRSQPQTNLSLQSLDDNSPDSQYRGLGSEGADSTRQVHQTSEQEPVDSRDTRDSNDRFAAYGIGPTGVGAGNIIGLSNHMSTPPDAVHSGVVDERSSASADNRSLPQNKDTIPANTSSPIDSPEKFVPGRVGPIDTPASHGGAENDFSTPHDEAELFSPRSAGVASSREVDRDGVAPPVPPHSAGSRSSAQPPMASDPSNENEYVAAGAAGAAVAGTTPAVRDELASLRRQLNEYRQRDFDAEHHSLKEAHAEQGRQLVSAQDAHSQLSRRYDSVNTQHSDLKKRYEFLQNSMDGHVKTLENQQKALEEANNRLREQQAQIAQFSQLQAENADLKHKLQLAEAARKHAEEQLESANTSYASLKSAHADLSAKHLSAATGGTRDAKDASASGAHNLNDQVTALVTQWSLFNSTASPGNGDLAGKRELSGGSDGDYRSLYESQKSAAEAAQRELESAYKEEAKLKAQLRELSAAHAASPTNADLDVLRDQHRSAVSRLDAQHQDTLRTVQTHANTVEDLRKRLAALEKDHTELNSEYQKAVDLSHNQQIALTKTREELNMSRAHAQRLEEQLEDASLNVSTPGGQETGDVSSHSVGSVRNDQAALVIRDLRAQVVILEEEMQNQREQIMRLKKAALNQQ